MIYADPVLIVGIIFTSCGVSLSVMEHFRPAAIAPEV